MAKKLRILGIAPYEGLAHLMRLYAKRRTDLHLTVMLGNLEDGVRLAKAHCNAYDVILSRANTASMISKSVLTPVIDIGISYYDMLRAFKLAENTGTKCAFLGFPSLTHVAKTLCDLLDLRIDIISISETDKANALLDHLKKLSYKTVICDTVPYHYAKLIGLSPILVTSGNESLEAALNSAISYYEKQRVLFSETAMLRRVLETSQAQYLILRKDGSVRYNTLIEDKAAEMTEKIRAEIPASLAEQKRSFYINVDNRLYSVLSHLIDDGEEEAYLIFRIMRSEIPLTYSKYGLSIMNKAQAEKSFLESFYSNTELARTALPDLSKFGNTDASIMITGETGTGRDRLAHLIYAKSGFSSSPLYIANCAMLNEKSWRFLMGSYNSPFTDNGNTIYISNLNTLSTAQQKQLLSVILDSNLHVRNRLIFSCGKPQGGETPHVAMEYANMLGSVILPIRPLREQRGDIVPSAGLYIDTLNRRLGKQVVGLTPGAAALLQNYDWPYNLTQFKRVLKEAVIRADQLYISEDIVRDALAQESAFSGCVSETGKSSALQYMDSQLDTNRTLDEISRDIVLYVLKSCNGNQTMAAKKLGISRTTLWRYIKAAG